MVAACHLSLFCADRLSTARGSAISAGCNVTRQWPVQSNAAAERTVVVPAAGHSPRSCCIQGVRLLSLAEPYLPLELHCRQLKYVEASKLRTGQVRPVRQPAGNARLF
ncbi:hypothetical protein WJX84_007386 [Apatococcus fuscideae]|uniref:Secreted protein n=1 Tax=Apatococcus fuscideae TaxID=2026836 RepID=A0AAW1T318_9CHLO